MKPHKWLRVVSGLCGDFVMRGRGGLKLLDPAWLGARKSKLLSTRKQFAIKEKATRPCPQRGALPPSSPSFLPG